MASLGSQKRDLIVRIDAETKGFEGGLQKSSAALRGMQAELRKLEAKQAKQHQAMTDLGKASMVAGAAVAAGVALSVRAAVQWESAWAGVTKTVDGNVRQMAVLESELRGLAKTLPATHQEIAAVAEAAGQLGIKRQDIADFTSTMVALSETTNLTADQAATAIARISNIMQIAPADVDRFGAALVALGNAGASTEAEIVGMATRIASAGSQIGLSGADVLAFANALSSVGIEAEAGGSAISRVFIDMRNAVMGATPALDVFADTAGMSAQEFARAFNEDAGLAVVSFVEGLGAMEEQGRNSNDVLSELGLTDIRVGNALRAAAGAGDLFRESLELGSEAWEANTALVEEAEKRYATTEAKMQVAKNAVNDLGITLGSTLLPALAGAAEGAAGMATWLGNLPGPVQTAAAVLGTLGATVALVGGAALLAVPKVAAMKVALLDLGVSATATSRTMTALSATMKTLGIAGAVIGIAVALDQLQESRNRLDVSANKWAESMLAVAEGGRATGEVARLLGADLENIGEAIDAANNNKLSLIDGRGVQEVEHYREVVKGLDAALAAMVTSGNIDAAKAAHARAADAALAQGRSMEEVTAAFPAFGDAMVGAEVQSEAAADGMDAVGVAAQEAAPKVQELTDAQKNLESALSSFVDPLTAYTDIMRAAATDAADAHNAGVDRQIKATQREWESRIEAAQKVKGVSDQTIHDLEDRRDREVEALGESKKSWEDYANSVEVSLTDVAEQLEADNRAHAEWETNLVKVAGKAGAEVAQILAEMGPEGIRLTAAMANGTEAEVQRMAAALIENAAIGGEGAVRELDAKMKLMAASAAAGGKLTAEQLATQLELGVADVKRIAEKYGIELAAGIDPLLLSLGRNAVGGYRVAGRGSQGGVTVNADGNLYEQHNAEIAPAGAWRVWAEPETGGEAYIPLAPSKHQRSVSIWQETGRRLGVFAQGGFWTPEQVPSPSSTAPYGPPISTAADGTMNAAYRATQDFLAANMEQGGSGGSATGLLPIMAAARQYVIDTYGIRNIGGFARRNIAGTSKLSDHARGKAIDVMTSNLGRGWAIANDFAFGEAGKRFRAENVIWQQSISSRGGPFRGMADRGSATQNHRDHVHIDTFAKGGILNPHVRDSGGPLLPGFTFNGTGRPEMVLPMAGGGIVSGGAVRPGGPSLTTATRGMTDISQIRRTVAAWEDYARSLDQAARKRALVAVAQEAAREVARAEAESGTAGAAAAKAQATAKEAETRATVVLANAQRRLQQAKSASARENAQAAVAEAQRKLTVVRESGAAKVSEANARAAKDATDDLRQARERLADANRAVKDFDFAAARDRESAAVDRLVDKLEREAEVRRQLADIRDEQKSRLDDMLDAEKAARDKGVDAAREFAERETEIGRKRVAAEVRFRKESAQAAKEYAKVQEQLRADSLEAARDLQAQQQRLLDARRDQLDGWARLDQVVVASWGNTVDQLLGNARSQAAQFEEWMASLADARRRGVSEQVIASLGLDEGPQALGQLRQFGQATAAEISALNAEVARRTVLAAQQTSREQRNGYGALGRDLMAAQQQYTDAITGLQQRFAAAQQDHARSLSDLQARFADDQAQLDEELTRAQGDLLVRQAEVSNELAAIGQEQGRSYGESLAQGLRSQIPAVVAAAQALQAAARNASIAGAGLPGVGVPGAPPKGTAGYVSIKGRQVHVNKAGIIDTRGDWYGKYPTQVASGTSGGVTVNVNAPVFGVDHLNRAIGVAVQRSLTSQRMDLEIGGRR